MHDDRWTISSRRVALGTLVVVALVGGAVGAYFLYSRLDRSQVRAIMAEGKAQFQERPFDTGWLAALALWDPAEALKAADHVPSAFQEDAFFEIAAGLAHAGRTTDALATARRTKANPGAALAEVAIGLARSGKSNGALAAAREAFALVAPSSDKPAILAKVAAVYSELGRTDSAREMAKRAFDAAGAEPGRIVLLGNGHLLRWGANSVRIEGAGTDTLRRITIAVQLARAGLIDEALAAIRESEGNRVSDAQTDDSRAWTLDQNAAMRAWALAVIGPSSAQEARTTALRISHPFLRCATLARAGDVEEAMIAARQMEPPQRLNTLITLVETLVPAGLDRVATAAAREALVTARSLGDAEARAVGIASASAVLADAGHFEESLEAAKEASGLMNSLSEEYRHSVAGAIALANASLKKFHVARTLADGSGRHRLGTYTSILFQSFLVRDGQAATAFRKRDSDDRDRAMVLNLWLGVPQ